MVEIYIRLLNCVFLITNQSLKAHVPNQVLHLRNIFISVVSTSVFCNRHFYVLLLFKNGVPKRKSVVMFPGTHILRVTNVF